MLYKVVCGGDMSVSLSAHKDHRKAVEHGGLKKGTKKTRQRFLGGIQRLSPLSFHSLSSSCFFILFLSHFLFHFSNRPRALFP